MALTDEQRKAIALKREEALRRAAKIKEMELLTASSSSTNFPPPTRPVFRSPPQNRQPMKSTSNSSIKQTTMNNFITQPLNPAPPTSNIKPTIVVKLKLDVEDRVKIEFYPFHSAIVDLIKQVPSRNYDPNKKLWTVSLSEHSTMSNLLKNAQSVKVEIEPIPMNILGMMTSFKPKPTPSDLTKIMDPELIKRLFPYQKEGVTFALERNGRILLADEMGLGKSVQALTIARYYKADWPLLIVCPASVKGAWKKQINTFFPIIHRIFIVDKSSDPLPDVRTSNTVAIMSYEQMVLKADLLKREKYSTIIFDESHMLKDGKARRTKVATDLAKIALHAILLSGTPALSRPSELFTQIRLIDHKLFTNFHEFAIRYCDGKQGRFCFEAKGCTNSEELAAIMFRRFMIRRLKADVLKDLPEKRREVVYVSGPTIDARMDDLQKAKADYEKINSMERKHESLLEFYSLTGIVKAAAVCEHILENYFYPDAPPRKVLIFAHHQIVLDTIQHEVNKRKLRSIRIDGKTPSHQRTALCDSFQNDEDVRVAVLSITAAGVGITLTAASVVVFAEIHFNPGYLVQAEDRAHRVGQKDSVFVQYLIAKKTADDVMWNMVQQKLDVLGQVSLSSDTFRTADKMHLRFNDVNQPGIAEYLQKTPEKGDGEWEDPADSEPEVICDSPAPKRIKN
ncbi:hypothetical protein L3Y34_000624 [Caenorhabditis briggsae]|uniref:SWI/SNF-related matrix-associated actin-dependent regulator of chromatin subfamily A-like protein 1 n=2 Tax=Caenorhabditis briggsae TaxID=6238 RepID=A0AAE9D9Y7_CAEBR|nr:hypothetical protein L3Y34_000624 [Caenorhabditis briggsae]